MTKQYSKELQHELLILSSNTENMLEFLKGSEVDIIDIIRLGWKQNRGAGHLEDIPFTPKKLIFSAKVEPKFHLFLTLKRGKLLHYNMYYSHIGPTLAAQLPLPLSGMRRFAERRYKK